MWHQSPLPGLTMHRGDVRSTPEAWGRVFGSSLCGRRDFLSVSSDFRGEVCIFQNIVCTRQTCASRLPEPDACGVTLGDEATFGAKDIPSSCARVWQERALPTGNGSVGGEGVESACLTGPADQPGRHAPCMRASPGTGTEPRRGPPRCDGPGSTQRCRRRAGGGVLTVGDVGTPRTGRLPGSLRPAFASRELCCKEGSPELMGKQAQ